MAHQGSLSTTSLLTTQQFFDAYPLPRIDDLIQKLGSAKHFSTLDFQQFHHQIPLVESDQEKTAFAAERKLYQYTLEWVILTVFLAHLVFC